METEPQEMTIKGCSVTISFNILLLGKDEAVLGMPQLKEYNLKINQITGEVDIRDT